MHGALTVIVRNVDYGSCRSKQVGIVWVSSGEGDTETFYILNQIIIIDGDVTT